MKRRLPLTVKARRIFSRCGPLMFICQRAPIGQVIAQEARQLGASAFGQVAKWSVAVVSGLGAFDCVSGATLVKQIAPSAGSSTVSATNGNALNFVVQVTGAPSTAKSWRLTGTLPTGLTHANATNSNTDSVTGVPRQNGSFPVTITAYEKSGFSGGSKAASFTINVTGGVSPPTIAAQPGSISIAEGGTATLSVSSPGATAFQWYSGASGDTSNPIGGAVGATFTTPALSVSTSFWVRTSNAGGAVNSSAALVTVINPPVISAQPESVSIHAGGSATLSVTATGSSPAFQWYTGAAGDITNPVAGAVAATFTTPPLAATASYWVRVTNSVGSVDSGTAVVTVIEPPIISSQPQSRTVNAGSSVTLTVGISGSSPEFQWYAGSAGDTANPVPGAVGAAFTTPALNVTTSYWVRVSNSVGAVDSATVVISVTDTFSSWAASHFSESQAADAAISGPAADPDGDGLSNEQEFVWGAQPLVADQPGSLLIAVDGGQLSLKFTAAAAAGPGYSGLIRHYAMESSSAPGGSVAWEALPGFSDITGQGQEVTFTASVGSGSGFDRLKVWLTPQ
ncbi:MAG: hypothetical protein JWM59_2186 [Verrucomicrobiales bacterium]|nr:hypothetical protein [Verrucomicrobiales bacterium]